MSTGRHAFFAVPESGGFDAYQPPSRLETERLSDDSPFLFGLHVDVNFHGGSKRIPNPIRDDPRLDTHVDHVGRAAMAEAVYGYEMEIC